MTHAALVDVAVRWLKGTRRCRVILAEKSTAGTVEIPDAIGWGPGITSVLVEVKVSRADFRRDRAKASRMGASMGRERWYLTPAGLVEPDEVPAPWGLLEWSGRIVLRRKRAEPAPPDTWSACSELALLLGELSAYQAQGLKYLPLPRTRAEVLDQVLDREQDIREAQILMGLAPVNGHAERL